jgi:glutathione S-transferase
VPAVRTSDGFTLYESRPICNYLAARFHCPLVPSVTDLQARALFDQAQSVEMCYFTHDTDLLMFEIAVKPAFMPGVPADADVVAGARKRLEAAFDIIGTILERQKFVAGDTFSLVDIFHLPPVKRLMDCGFGDVVLDRASVHTWWQRCLEIPAIARYLNDEMVVLPPK